jgi:hypothetical protein
MALKRVHLNPLLDVVLNLRPSLVTSWIVVRGRISRRSLVDWLLSKGVMIVSVPAIVNVVVVGRRKLSGFCCLMSKKLVTP